MKSSKVIQSNGVLSLLLVIMAVGLVFLVIMGAFYFGTLWAGRKGTSPLPIIIPASQTPYLPWTETPVVVANPTETALPTETVTATEMPTATPVPTATPFPTATPLPDPEEWATFIKDVTIPGGTYFGPKTSFQKTWRIKNIGETTWTKLYDLVYVSGSALTETTIIPLPMKVEPGEMVDLSINLTSPKTPGKYEGRWMLRTADGLHFGMGSRADQPLTVMIQVLNVERNAEFDFILRMCQARWWNGEGIPLRCPSVFSNTNGFVALLQAPHLENKKADQPALWVRPNNKMEGKIAGMYPAYKVKDGDHFKATIGCLDNSKGCKVVFKLQYQIGGDPMETLQTWYETYNGSVTRIDVDLSPLAGQEVQFILRALGYSNQFDKNNGFWLAPHIINTK